MLSFFRNFSKPFLSILNKKLLTTTKFSKLFKPRKECPLEPFLDILVYDFDNMIIISIVKWIFSLEIFVRDAVQKWKKNLKALSEGFLSHTCPKYPTYWTTRTDCGHKFFEQKEGWNIQYEFFVLYFSQKWQIALAWTISGVTRSF